MAAFFRAEDGPVAVTLSDGDVARLVGATIRFTSGAAAGRKLYCTGAFNGGLLSSVISGPVFEDVEAGDEVVIDNRDWLAYCYYHRYQAPPGNPAARQFIVDGRPIYPQRPLFPMTEMRSTTRAGDHTGRFTGKMIIVQNAMDDYAWPHGAVVYATLVREALGDRTDGQLRVWFNDNASHVPGSFLGPATASRLIDYGGSVDQALRDLIAWVEQGVEPPATTGYHWDEQSSRLDLPGPAARRRGIQPVVTVRATVRPRPTCRPAPRSSWSWRVRCRPGPAPSWPSSGTPREQGPGRERARHRRQVGGRPTTSPAQSTVLWP